MATTIDRFRAKLERRAATLAPDLRKAMLRGWATLRKSFSERELIDLIRAGNLDAILTEPQAVRALASLAARLRDGIETSARIATRELPLGASAGTFDVLNPRVIDGIRELNTRVITTLASDARETVRTVVEQGLKDGLNPRSIARDLRDAIGLAPNQWEAVYNFRAMLEANDPEALTRKLRDRRFDSTVRRAMEGDGLSPKQIDAMTNAYLRQMVAFNAETNARTAANDAQKLGHHLAWGDAVDRGDIDGETLTKRWSGTLDDREREEHVAMEGETVAWDAPFSNGQMLPGDTEFNCRCVPIYETRGTKRAGAFSF